MNNTIKKQFNNEKCSLCNGCISCTDERCIYHSDGNPDDCWMEKCIYCTQFLKKQKLFLNNVG